MATYEAFLPHVLPYVPNCLEDQAVVAIRNACIDFCRESHLLQDDITPANAVAGTNTYSLSAPAGYVPAQVLSLYYVGRRLDRKSQAELEKLYTRDWQSLSGTPKVFTQLKPDTFTVALSPSENVTAAFTGRLAYMPSRASTTVDDMVLERFLDTVVHGALLRLKRTPDQPYTDPKGVPYCQTEFRKGCAEARAFVSGGMNHAPLRVRFQRIW